MKKNLLHRLIYIFSFSLCTFINNYTMASSEETIFNLKEIEQGIYLHEGVHVNFDDIQNDDIANIGFILGEKCIAVIDTGGSVRIGKNLLKTIRKKTNLPICYVINTHIHFDHYLGNLAFINEQSEFIGHQNIADTIDVNREYFLDQFPDNLGPNPTSKSITEPNITVQDTMKIDLGERFLLLTAYKTAHSHSDLTIFDSKTKTLWAGDLLFRERIPALDGSLKGWLSVLEMIKRQDILTIIPGHGTPTKKWMEAIAVEEEYLYLLLNETRQAIAEGQFMGEILETVGSEEKEKWLLYDQHHKRNVSKAFTELEWE